MIQSAETVPADKYGYRPTPSVRTSGEQIAHVADSHNYYCARAAGRRVEWSDAIEKGPKDKATLLQKLKQSNDACTAAYAGPFAPPMMASAVTKLRGYKTARLQNCATAHCAAVQILRLLRWRWWSSAPFCGRAVLCLRRSQFFSLATLNLRGYAGVRRSRPPPVRGKD